MAAIGAAAVNDTSESDSFVEPLVPLTEIDELIFDSGESVLIENLINGSGKSFRISLG